MNRIEELLQETLDHRGSSPPPLPDLMTAVAQRRRADRRRTRTVVLSAAAALIVVSAGSVTAALSLTGRHNPPATAPVHNPAQNPTSTATENGVPFAAIPAGAAGLTTDLPMTTSGTPACTASDLQLHAVGQRAVDGVRQLQLVAQSVARHTCRLDRYAIGLGISSTSTGPLLDIGEVRNQDFNLRHLYRIDPRSSILINASWQNWCGRPLRTAHPVLRLSPVTRVTADDTVTPPACTDHTDPAGSSSGLEVDTIAAAGSILTAAPAIHTPATVRAGATLHYQIILTNPTDTAILLNPCPVYTQGLDQLTTRGDHWTTTSYRLNCSAVRAIAAHTTITLQMQIPIPTNGAGHTYDLDWAWGNGKQAKIGGPNNNLHYASFQVTP